MKNRLLIFSGILLAGIIGFYSCEKDKGGPGTRDLIVSTNWAYDTLEISDLTNSGLVIAAAFTHLAYENSVYDFNDNGTYTLTSNLINETGTWELVDSKILVMDRGTEDEMELEILEINFQIIKLILSVEGDFFGTPVSGDVILIFKAKKV
jgi:hypothetical protein